MDAYRICIRLDFAPGTEIDLESLIPIFHRWIRDRELDELLIDVADYRHVPDGPGVLLIAHEAHYGIDNAAGRPGLVYARKRPAAVGATPASPGASFADLLRHAFGQALAAARALEREAELDGLALPADRWTLALHDRLLAPNDEATRRVVEPELRRLLEHLYGPGTFELRPGSDPAECFALSVIAREAPGVEALQQRLETSTPEVDATVRPGWAENELHLSPELREELRGRVALGYPHETCGVLVGRSLEQRTEVQRVVETRNVDRERPGDRYRLDPRDFIAADDEARRDGLDIVGIWHSHPECPARPSKTDLESAWEGFSYLIVGVTGDGDVDFHSWRLDGDRFVAEEIRPPAAPSRAPALQFDRPLKEERLELSSQPA